MPTRKKYEDQQSHGKCRSDVIKPPRRGPAVAAFDLAALLMIGAEPVVINGEDNDNLHFMSEYIDPA